uniref:Ribosomal protein L6 n=1 Tax=Taeniopygia guttata TaxID=59729 RepID=A0A674GUJ0_TAEGU
MAGEKAPEKKPGEKKSAKKKAGQKKPAEQKPSQKAAGDKKKRVKKYHASRNPPGPGHREVFPLSHVRQESPVQAQVHGSRDKDREEEEGNAPCHHH